MPAVSPYGPAGSPHWRRALRIRSPRVSCSLATRKTVVIRAVTTLGRQTCGVHARPLRFLAGRYRGVALECPGGGQAEHAVVVDECAEAGERGTGRGDREPAAGLTGPL